MTRVQPIGEMSTPYGVSVPLYPHPSLPDEHVIDFDGTMTLAGIYDQKQRAACCAALNGAFDNGPVSVGILFANGGQPCPVQPLPRPIDPEYPRLPKHEDEIPVEAWITAALEATWDERADKLLGIVRVNLERSVGELPVPIPPELLAHIMCTMLTATLENLGETEIHRIEAAALYAISTHEEWMTAGLAWLTPFRDTWFRDWAKARPDWRKVAEAARSANSALPIWIVGGAA